MKRIPFVLLALGLQAAVADDYTGWQSNGKGWVPVLIEDFDSPSLNTDVWGRIPYVNWQVAEWRKYQSTDPDMVTMSDGALNLWARYGNYTTQSNKYTATDTYACGGVQTLGKFSFQYGYVEVRAKFNHTWGCWPAIWLMPVSGTWPTAGEIDLMEHLNNDAKVYQTLHYGTNDASKQGVQPGFGSVAALNDQWHTYGLLWQEGKIQFLVDGSITATYVTGNEWPFDNNEFYLILDEQIGGNWVQSAAKSAGYTYNDGINKDALQQYGSAMSIDYVHVYSDAKYMSYVPAPDDDTVPEPATSTLSLLALTALAIRRRRK